MKSKNTGWLFPLLFLFAEIPLVSKNFQKKKIFLLLNIIEIPDKERYLHQHRLAYYYLAMDLAKPLFLYPINWSKNCKEARRFMLYKAF